MEYLVSLRFSYISPGRSPTASEQKINSPPSLTSVMRGDRRSNRGKAMRVLSGRAGLDMLLESLHKVVWIIPKVIKSLFIVRCVIPDREIST